MADHLHTQLAQAVSDVVASSEVSLVNGRSFPYQVYPVEVGDLPYGSVWIPREETQRESGDGGGATTLVESTVEVRVAIFTDGEESEIEDRLNQGMLQVQIALADGVQLASGEVDLDFRGCDKSFERGDLPYGQVLMRFEAEVAYLKNDPTRLAWQ